MPNHRGQAAIVEPVAPFQRREIDGLDRQRPRRRLTLAVDRLSELVVLGVANTVYVVGCGRRLVPEGTANAVALRHRLLEPD